MSWNQIQSKYGGLYKQKLERWQDSQAVVRLQEFLQAHQDLGFLIRIRDGQPVLHFDPPLESREVSETARYRWDKALIAEDLYFEAQVDLDELHRGGNLEIPSAPPFNVCVAFNEGKGGGAGASDVAAGEEGRGKEGHQGKREESGQR